MASAFDNTGIATSVAMAVAIHNIPEGIAVALPLLYGTGDRRKAFGWARSPVWQSRWASWWAC